jgi:hypothetical protein
MRVYVVAALVAALLSASEDQKQSPAGELGQLTILEKQVFEAWKNQNAGTLQSLLRDDYIEISGTGPERRTKMDVLKALPRVRLTDYTLEDVHLLPLHKDAAILTYKLRLKGLPDEKGFFANPAYASSAWVRQESAWVSVFRQWTPLSKEASGPTTVTSFETTLAGGPYPADGTIHFAPDTARYLYKGTTKLEDIHATFAISLGDGKVSSQAYWATWEPGELKEISLAFLAFGVGSVQRIELSGTATMGGKKIVLSNVARKDARIKVDWKSGPPTLRLP